MQFKEALVTYLEANDIKFSDKETKLLCQCLSPTHEDNNMSAFIKLDEGNEYFHCSSCKLSMNSVQLHNLISLGFDPNMSWKAQIDRILKQAEPKLEKESAQIFLPIKEATFDKPYRGISAETFSKVSAYHTFKDSYYGRRIIIPIYNYRNELRSFEAISTSSKIQPKILRPKNVLTSDLFGFEHLLGESDSVFLCEGLFSALSFWELGYQGLSNFGIGSIKDKIKTLHLKGVKNVILAGDADSAGKQFNKECYHLLKHNFTVTFFQFPYNFQNKGDANDLLKIGREVLQECIDKTLTKGLIKIKCAKIAE